MGGYTVDLLLVRGVLLHVLATWRQHNKLKYCTRDKRDFTVMEEEQNRVLRRIRNNKVTSLHTG